MGVGNNASEAIAIAAGAAFECRARNRIFLHGQPLDAHIYALIPADFCSKEDYIALSEVNCDRQSHPPSPLISGNPLRYGRNNKYSVI